MTAGPDNPYAAPATEIQSGQRRSGLNPKPAMILFAVWCVVALTLFILSSGSSSLLSEMSIFIWSLAASIGFFLAAYLGTGAKAKMRFLRCLVIAGLSIPLVQFSLLTVLFWIGEGPPPNFAISIIGAAVLSPLFHTLLFRVLLSIPLAKAIRLGCFYCLSLIVVCVVTGVAKAQGYLVFTPGSMTGELLGVYYICLGLVIGAVLYSLSPGRAVPVTSDQSSPSV